MDKLSRDFYLRDTLTVARDLIGSYLVRQISPADLSASRKSASPPELFPVHPVRDIGDKIENQVIAGRITETEAYVGAIDKACHAYGGRLTPRTKIMFGPGGYAYIYFIYGMYHCMNVVTEPEGCGSAVLIRGLELVTGQDLAAWFRYGVKYENLSPYQLKNITNGPGKLCKALHLAKEQNGEDLLGTTLYIAKSFPFVMDKKYTIYTGKRIGIDYAEEARDFMWRFYVK